MDATEFRAYFDTLDLDATLSPGESIRADTMTLGRTLAFGALPSVDLGATTNPEFELGDTIGEGGMGVVRSANQIALHREVAVKTLRPNRRDDAARDGLLHEALVTGGLEHPNVVPVYTLGQTADGAPVIVMKKIEGVPWSACLADPDATPGFDHADPLGWHLEIFSQVCQAVHFAHSRGILHRDIKPDNVMIGAFGEVYLVDWGVAVTIDDDKADFLVHARDAQGISGTPSYMAPEMTTGKGADLGVHTDVYLLGATLYHVLTGMPPHRGDSLFAILFQAYESAPADTEAEVPRDLLDVCRVAMARLPAERFESAEAIRRALSEFERHRNSISLADEARQRLEEMTRLAAAADPENEPRLRGLAGECRFGFEQALRVWPDNQSARDDRDRALRLMIRWEIGTENLRAAEALLAHLESPEPEIEQELEGLRAVISARQREIVELREHHHDTNLAQGAQVRASAAVAGVILWTIMPLVSGQLVKAGIMPMTGPVYLLHSLSVLAALAMLGVVLWYKRVLNRANLRITRFLLAFGVWLPLYRLVIVMTGTEPTFGLVVENLVYALVFAGVAVLSDRFAFLGMLCYCASGVFAAMHPNYVFEATATANFLAIGWLALLWSRQGLVVDENIASD